MTSGYDYMQKQVQTLTKKQKEIFDLLNHKHSAQVLQHIQKDLLFINDVIPALFTIVKCYQPPSSRVDNCFRLLKYFIDSFGIPFVLRLNNHLMIEDLRIAVQHGWMGAIKSILKDCLGVFDFDKEKLAIRHIVSFCCELEVQQPTPNSNSKINLVVDNFTDLFQRTQQVLSAFGKTMINSEFEKEKLGQQIRSILDDISLNLKGNLFNALEKEYIIECSDRLGVILIELLQTRTRSIEDQHSSSLSTKSSNDLPNIAIDTTEEFQVPANRFRRKFFKGECLLEDESATIEYKDYFWPFNEDLNKTLRSTINSFVNRRGGRIYIGVDDNHLVKGIKLLMKDRDALKQHIVMLIKDFDPPIKNEELIKVDFLGISDPNQANKVIPGLFVVKIIVHQGDPSVIYSESRDYFQAYMRNDGQSLRLNAREIREYTQKRFTSPETKVSDSEFEDPKPEPIKDKDERQVSQDKKNNQSAPDILTMLTHAFKEAGQILYQPTNSKDNTQISKEIGSQQLGQVITQPNQLKQDHPPKQGRGSHVNRPWQKIWKEKFSRPKGV